MSHFHDLSARVGPAAQGLRLDQALAQVFPFSRRRLRTAIAEGGVYLNGKRCRTAGRSVRSGDRLRIVLLEQETLVPLSAEQLLWRDDSLFVVHKKAGQYAQEALHRSQGTLPVELAELLGLKAYAAHGIRPVNRLDLGTSGIVLYCTDAKRLQHLQHHWHACSFKRYLAVVSPPPEWQQQLIDLRIGRRRDAQGRYAVCDSGRPCLTHARVIDGRMGRALLELVPETGRTHQLRVHLSALGCPILGDHRYGGAAHPRMMLHAHYLRLDPPAMERSFEWVAEPEEDWKW